MSLPFLAIYSVACLSLGARVLGLILRTDSLHGRCGVVVGLSSAMLLGQGVLANIWLLIGLTGWFKTWGVAAVLMVCVLVGWRSARSLLTAFGRSCGGQWLEIRSEKRPWRLLGYLLIAQIVVMGLGALFMPARGDAVAFYMTVAKYMAHYDRLVPLPGTYHTFTQIGLQGEMHYAALMSLGSASAAKGFVWPISLAGLGMLLGIGGMVGLRRRGKWIAIAMYFTSTAVTLISVDAKVDLFAAAMGVAAIYWALRTSDSPWSAACLCGLFTSMAAVAKFSYIGALVPGVFLLLAWRCFTARRGKSAILTGLGVLAVWGGCALLAGIPHLVKNGVLFGNPLAPFVGSSNAWHIQDWFKNEAIVRWIHMTYPLALVYGDYGMQEGTLSPLILAFFPLVILSWRRAKPLRSPLFQVTVAAIFGLVVFTCLSPNVFAPRYVLAPLLILILPAAMGAQLSLESGRCRGVLSAVIVGAVIVVLLGRLSLDVSRGGRDAVKYGWGRFIDSKRLLPDCGSARTLNAHAGYDEPVLIASYYCYWVRPDLIKSCLTAKQLAPMRERATLRQRWRRLCQSVARLIPDMMSRLNAEQLAPMRKLPTPEQRWRQLCQRGFRLVRDLMGNLTLEQLAPARKLPTSEERWRWLYDQGVRLILLDARGVFGAETPEPESIIVYPDSESLSPDGRTTGLLNTSEIPDGLAVKVLYRKKGRIVLQLRKSN